MQESARATIANVISKRGAAVHATQAALVSMSPDGAVRAMIGGKDYRESAFNRAVKAHRSPGSAFKPFVYLTALEHGLTRDTIRYDEPITIKNWSPDNYTEDHVGPVTLEYALANSINTIAVELGQEVGLPNVGGDRASPWNQLGSATQRIARARHVGGYPARTHRCLCELRIAGHASGALYGHGDPCV